MRALFLAAALLAAAPALTPAFAGDDLDALFKWCDSHVRTLPAAVQCYEVRGDQLMIRHNRKDPTLAMIEGAHLNRVRAALSRYDAGLIGDAELTAEVNEASAKRDEDLFRSSVAAAPSPPSDPVAPMPGYLPPPSYPPPLAEPSVDQDCDLYGPGEFGNAIGARGRLHCR